MLFSFLFLWGLSNFYFFKDYKNKNDFIHSSLFQIPFGLSECVKSFLKKPNPQAQDTAVQQDKHIKTIGVEWEGAVKLGKGKSHKTTLQQNLLNRLIMREFPQANHPLMIKALEIDNFESKDYWTKRFSTTLPSFKKEPLKNRTELLDVVNNIFNGVSQFEVIDVKTNHSRIFSTSTARASISIIDTKGEVEVWVFEKDISIIITKDYNQWENIEIVTPILKTSEDIQFFLSFLQDMIKKDLITTQNTQTSGIHIHIGAEPFSSADTKLMIKTFSLLEKYLFHYFKTSPARIRTQIQPILKSDRDYSQMLTNLNIAQDYPQHTLFPKNYSLSYNPALKTFEFRLFNSTDNTQEIQFQIQFIQSLMNAILKRNPQLVKWVQQREKQISHPLIKSSKDFIHSLKHSIHPELKEIFEILNLQPKNIDSYN